MGFNDSQRTIHQFFGPDGGLSRREWRMGGVLHREDGPAIECYRADGSPLGEYFYVAGAPCNCAGGPTSRSYHANGNVQSESYVDGLGRFHREDGPAITCWDEAGRMTQVGYLNHGVRVAFWAAESGTPLPL